MSLSFPDDAPTEQIASAFHVERMGTPQPLGAAWDYGWLCGHDTVLSRATSARQTWSARVRDNLTAEGLTIVRPGRSTDGRYVVAGWRASGFVAGEVTDRVDEVVAAAFRLDEALRHATDLPAMPPHRGEDAFSLADRGAWTQKPGTGTKGKDSADIDARVDDGAFSDLIDKLKSAMRPVTGPDQACHADMLATTLFGETGDPVVTDLVGVRHPFGYTAALAVIDGLIAGAVDAGIIDRFSGLLAPKGHFHQLLLRALTYRVYVHALLDEPAVATGKKLLDVAETVVSHPLVTL